MKASAPTPALPRWLPLAPVLALGALLRLYWALHDQGLYWPDEVYQSLEPAHRLVFGYGLQAWEFIEGARSWALPWLVAALMKAATWVGLDAPPGYLGVVKGAFALVGAATAWGAARLALGLGARALPAAAGAALFALAAVPVYFGPRAMSENASALAAVWGLALALPPGASRREGRWGAALLGLAVLLRLQSALFCVALVGVLAVRRAWRPLLDALLVLALWALLYGLLDRLTWGGWWHSARVYLAFNVVEGKAAGWGTQPFGYYGRVLLEGMPAVTLVAGALALGGAWGAPGLAVTGALFFLAHALQPHKELRFLMPLFPLLAALAGVGLTRLVDALRTRELEPLLALAVAVVALHSGLSAGRLRFRDVGQYLDSKPDASAWDDFGAANRLLMRAGREPDLCGLKVEAVHLAWTGGQSSLHRDVPLYGHLGPPRSAGTYNYVLTVREAARGGRVVALDGPYALVRLDRAGCVRDPNYSPRLP